MTLRLTDDEQEKLRLRTEQEGRSIEDVARDAITEYVQTHGHREHVDMVIKNRVEKGAELIRRLADQ